MVAGTTTLLSGLQREGGGVRRGGGRVPKCIEEWFSGHREDFSCISLASTVYFRPSETESDQGEAGLESGFGQPTVSAKTLLGEIC